MTQTQFTAAALLSATAAAGTLTYAALSLQEAWLEGNCFPRC